MADINQILDKYMIQTDKKFVPMPDTIRYNGITFENVPDNSGLENVPLYFDDNDLSTVDQNAIEQENHKTYEGGQFRYWKRKQEFRGS